ncbi:flagellar basal-body rod protein FlgF [Aureimonas mangrovi]|uniref:flagellar basal-body rod protein FlgF n=1 Tax=Aureimonas mangrovi TaxID=2758041 RepID=UPI00163DBF60|nr:flagellar basal-body rod protein FlgF [Aureimonas mangrovi]
MQTSIPVALSAQIATEKRLDTIAHNLANLRTAGFRAEEVKFETVLSTTERSRVAFVSSGDRYLSTRAGELTATGNDLDIAVSGDGWLAFQGPNGPVYTRDGRMMMGIEGDLTTLTGRPILDVGGAPLQLDPAGGPIEIARDGMIMQNGAQVGAVGLFQMQPETQLTRFDTSGVLPDKQPVPVVEFGETGVVQRFVEGSNVNPILEITRLIEVQRAFEQAASLTQASERALDSAIAALGGGR